MIVLQADARTEDVFLPHLQILVLAFAEPAPVLIIKTVLQPLDFVQKDNIVAKATADHLPSLLLLQLLFRQKIWIFLIVLKGVMICAV